MNYIVASLYFHCGDVLAFELAVRALNDYHLKECHMIKLPGLFYHCEIIKVLLKQEMPILMEHFEDKIDILVIC